MLNFETSAEDGFWKEKMNRYIKECNSIEELKEISLLLVQIATTRQSVIKGLIKQEVNLMSKSLTNWIDEAKKTEPDWMLKVQKPNPWPGDQETQS